MLYDEVTRLGLSGRVTVAVTLKSLEIPTLKFVCFDLKTIFKIMAQLVNNIK